MVYAQPAKRLFVTSQKLEMKSTLTEAQRARRAFLRTHDVSLVLNPDTQEYRLIVKEIAEDERNRSV